MPTSIVSDRDPRFTSNFWRAFVKLLGTELAMSTAYHPQSDGQTERMNRTMEDMLRGFVGPRQGDWCRYLSMVEFACMSYCFSCFCMGLCFFIHGSICDAPALQGSCKCSSVALFCLSILPMRYICGSY
jgi:hypothetical protein